MTSKLNVERVAQAIHAVTGKWLSGAEAETLTQLVGTREELLAHGIIDLGWLEYHPVAKRHFTVLKQSAALPSEPLRGMAWQSSPIVETGPSKDELLAIVKQFAEGPTEVDPLKTLAHIGSSIG